MHSPDLHCDGPKRRTIDRSADDRGEHLRPRRAQKRRAFVAGRLEPARRDTVKPVFPERIDDERRQKPLATIPRVGDQRSQRRVQKVRAQVGSRR
ncbi:MAG: hypothetical protein AAFQ51_05985, partial [Pseudomonadota bacterium]